MSLKSSFVAGCLVSFVLPVTTSAADKDYAYTQARYISGCTSDKEIITAFSVSPRQYSVIPAKLLRDMNDYVATIVSQSSAKEFLQKLNEINGDIEAGIRSMAKTARIDVDVHFEGVVAPCHPYIQDAIRFNGEASRGNGGGMVIPPYLWGYVIPASS